MKWFALLLAVGIAAHAGAETVKFDSTPAGALPPGWSAGITGEGRPRWAVATNHVLLQSGQAASHGYPWCVQTNVAIRDGFVEVKFKPVSGKEDQAGGVIWRWQDGDNYYIARGNALEDNVILFRTAHGVRKQLHSVPMKVTPGQWHTLRTDFSGTHITVTFDGQKAMEWDDDMFQKPGAVGVWTKADSVTMFDDFGYGKK